MLKALSLFDTLPIFDCKLLDEVDCLVTRRRFDSGSFFVVESVALYSLEILVLEDNKNISSLLGSVLPPLASL